MIGGGFSGSTKLCEQFCGYGRRLGKQLGSQFVDSSQGYLNIRGCDRLQFSQSLYLILNLSFLGGHAVSFH